MRPAALSTVVVASLAAAAGCPGGGAGLGDACSSNGDCGATLQCQASVCVPRCVRAPECGDGFACTGGLCVAATGQTGAACTSETDCAAGLACQLDGSAVGDDGHLLATCSAAIGERPADAACDTDADCRNGTCALGRCVDLCTFTGSARVDHTTDDDGSFACVDGDNCTLVPRVGDAAGAPFGGCLPAHATITWTIPVSGPEATIAVPVPASAVSFALSMEVDDVNQEVGALSVLDPTGRDLFELTADPATTLVRHLPGLGQSVLAVPSDPDTLLGDPNDASVPKTELPFGAYQVTVASLRPPFGVPPVIGSATPRVTAIAKLGTGHTLDLHFYFLDFTDHPCGAFLGANTLTATTASTAQFFQKQYISELKSVFANSAGIALGQLTYEDLGGHPDLDGLDIANAPALLALGTHATGVNVFFVRSISPVGLQTFGPNPGPGGLAGTRQSGIVVGLDTMCYRTWPELARLTAHELAHYMGLYDNITLEAEPDPIADSDGSARNLMFYSESGGGDLSAGHGVDLSAGQLVILQRSGVLR